MRRGGFQVILIEINLSDFYVTINKLSLLARSHPSLSDARIFGSKRFERLTMFTSAAQCWLSLEAS